MRLLAAAGVLAAGLLAGPTAYATSQGLKDAKDQVTTLEQEKKKTEDALKQLEGLKADTEKYVRQLDGNLNELAGELTRLEDQIAQKEGEIAQAQTELAAARETEANQYDSMKLRIKYMYERGDTSYLDLILQSKSISQMLNRAEYVSKITEYDRDMLEKYRETKEAVAEREAALEQEHVELVALQDSTKAKQASVKQLLADKEAEIKAQEDKMRQIEAEMKRREEEAKKKAQQAGQTYTVKDLGNISFKWPCPSSSRITSNFGDRESPTEGASSNHKGMDIGASTGADIIAAADGEVVIATYSYSAGNYIMIDHGGGVSTVYMHCSQLLVSKGAKVKQGQVIAKVGSTGYSTGPHLHFGIRSGGTYVNPRNYVSP